MHLTNKVALITGAGSGIGKASALLFATAGAKVAALSRTASEVHRTAEEIRQAGGESLALTADIADFDQMAAAFRKIMEHWGRLDIVFANAGINGVWTKIEDLALEEWNHTIHVNLTGTFIALKLAVPLIKQHGQGGSIIVCSSVNGTRVFSNVGATAYSCTKAAQVAMTKMLALELAPSRIRVNVICPGAIYTDIRDNTEYRNLERRKNVYVPLTGKPGSAEQVAQLALFLASDAASHISGTEVWIDGAESLVQGF
ncbi:MAG: SDR family NAD(P)-dependent oxidoreductase [Anaerolineae bacterium]|nr:SDR family NAD(P)-dependent oxidoreductase [Anaerolineae bacterium]